MNKRIYTVLDIRAKDLGMLMTFTHDAPAIRAFQDACNDPKTMMHRHPDDYLFICIGEIDEQTYAITPYTPYTPLLTARQVVGTDDNDVQPIRRAN